MKALENLSRDVVPLGCFAAAVLLVMHTHPVWGGVFVACACLSWLGERA
jgi:hypothetical protein